MANQIFNLDDGISPETLKKYKKQISELNKIKNKNNSKDVLLNNKSSLSDIHPLLNPEISTFVGGGYK